jgi:RNA polymerase sigma-70 factor (ECF subfamily)
LIFRDFFDEHAAFVWRVVRHLGAREADVADLAQEVFLVAHDKRAQLRSLDGARSWLYRIAFGVVRNHQRLAHVRREVPTDAPGEDLAVAGHRDEVANRQVLRAVLDQLEPDKRAVLVAQAIEEMSMNEIAEALSIPVKTAYSRLYAAQRAAAAAFARLAAEPVRDGEDDAA